MKALIDGPQWAGMWTEITADELQRLGFKTRIFYNNKKLAKTRFVSKLNKIIPPTKRLLDWERFQRQDLFARFEKDRFDLYFSIQGKIDSDFLENIKKLNPEMKIIYWFGDVLVESAKKRFDSLKAASLSGNLDAFLVSYRGTYNRLLAQGFRNVHYFPFGYSKVFHRVGDISTAERMRFTCDVSFVGTHYPERAEIIRYLNRYLREPVQVWGRGWQGSGIKSNGRLSLEESLKVYACSKVSLNIHHHLTDNGFNMKSYEIPASGGFQILDWQQELVNSPLDGTPSYNSKEELLEKVQKYLGNDQERLKIKETFSERVSTNTEYGVGFMTLLRSLDMGR